MKRLMIILSLAATVVACQQETTMKISDITIQQAVATVLTAQPEADSLLLLRGAQQVAALWRTEDGTEADYTTLISSSFASTAEAKQQLYDRLAPSTKHP